MTAEIRRSSRSVRRAACSVLFAFAIVSTVRAQDPAAGNAEELISRIERIERDRQLLIDRLDALENPAGSTAVTREIEGFVAFDEPIRAADAIPGSAANDPGDSVAASDQVTVQAGQLSALQKAFKQFQDDAGKKKYPNISMNGVFQADSAWVHQDADSRDQFGPIEDGAGFRRARLSAKGSVTEHTNYFFQTDIGTAGIGRPSITDIWVEETGVPFFGNVRVGQWKQPFSLEVVSSFRYTTFMERSSLFQAFTPFRRLGAGFYDHSEDLSMTWAASAFHGGQDQYGDTYTNDGGYGTAERFTFLPYWERDGKEYLHLGVGHFFNAPANDVTLFRSIPELFIGAQTNGPTGTSGQPIPGALNGVPFFVNTGSIGVNAYNVLGTEILVVDGPFSFQSEAMVNFVDQTGSSPLAVLPGAYAQIGYFLTGEHRPYDRKAGAIDRVIPSRNMKFCGDNGNGYGCGAWELAGRVSYLDLNDENIRGGTLTDTTVGLNWYLNPYLKCVFNWVHAISDSPTFSKSETDLFAMRTQVDF